jgi:copper chaperone
MPADSQHLIFSVPDVMCQHCRMAIEKAVSGLAGIEKVSVDLDNKQVEVLIADPGASSDDVRRAIEEEGYAVTGVRAV